MTALGDADTAYAQMLHGADAKSSDGAINAGGRGKGSAGGCCSHSSALTQRVILVAAVCVLVIVLAVPLALLAHDKTGPMPPAPPGPTPPRTPTTWYVAVNALGNGRTQPAVFRGSVVTAHALSDAAGLARAGDVIQLLPGVYRGLLHWVLANCSGSADAPVTVRGLDILTIFDARSVTGDLSGRGAALGLKDVSWLVVEHIQFAGDFDTQTGAIAVLNAQYVTIRQCEFVGFWLAVMFRTLPVHHILLEENKWTQDVTGSVWFVRNWQQSHDDTAILGGFFGLIPSSLATGADGVYGDIVMRRNLVRNAFHGVFEFLPFPETEPVREWCMQPQLNANVQIVDNVFENIRDIPIKPAYYCNARNWIISGNRFLNTYVGSVAFQEGHFDGIYVFANMAWETGLQPLLSTGHTTKKLIKLDFADDDTFPFATYPYRDGVWYFHNSAALTGYVFDGFSANITLSSNALLFVGGANGTDSRPSALLNRTWVSTDFVMNSTIHLDFDVSNQPLDPALAAFDGGGFVEPNGKTGAQYNPLFANPTAGAFALLPGSPAVGAAGTVALKFFGYNSTRDEAPYRPNAQLNAGAMQFLDLPLRGPLFRTIDAGYAQRPRIVDWRWRNDTNGVGSGFSVTLTFQVDVIVVPPPADGPIDQRPYMTVTARNAVPNNSALQLPPTLTASVGSGDCVLVEPYEGGHLVPLRADHSYRAVRCVVPDVTNADGATAWPQDPYNVLQISTRTDWIAKANGDDAGLPLTLWAAPETERGLFALM